MAYKKKILAVKQDAPVSMKEEVFDEKVNTVEEEIQNKVRVRPSGNWKKVSQSELESLEKQGLLKGYDPETQEALINNKEA
jgi:bifunctional DNase/RNase